MKSYYEMSVDELKSEKVELEKRIAEFADLKLSLDMTRGKPSSQQLDLTNEIFDDLNKKTNGFKAANGSDCRNYGVPLGITEARELFAGILGTDAENILLGNSSSLNMMFDALMRAIVFGEYNSEKPWSLVPKKKWLCPVPGYDRHFKVTELLGFEMINVPLNDDGPDMDIVEKLVSSDPDIKGMWCIPLYSNPDGVVYSEEVCRRLCSMKTAANDFRIFWDNAYVVHHLYADVAKQGKIPDILGLAKECGNADRFYEFASTSKVTFAGAGLACFATNKENFDYAKKIINVQTIGANKVNQIAHTVMLPNVEAVNAQMMKHADILRPKFDLALSILDKELTDCSAISWRKPLGGYFISVFVADGTADKVVGMCKELGVAFTPAGATYPYGKDPSNSNIRIAPSFPPIDDIDKAVTVFAVCAKLCAVNKILEG